MEIQMIDEQTRRIKSPENTRIEILVPCEICGVPSWFRKDRKNRICGAHGRRSMRGAPLILNKNATIQYRKRGKHDGG